MSRLRQNNIDNGFLILDLMIGKNIVCKDVRKFVANYYGSLQHCTDCSLQKLKEKQISLLKHIRKQSIP